MDAAAEFLDRPCRRQRHVSLQPSHFGGGDTLTGKAFPITWRLSDINLENKIFLAAVILVYFLFLCGALSGRRAASEKSARQSARRSRWKADGKQYLMPSDAKTAWRIYRKSSAWAARPGSTGDRIVRQYPACPAGAAPGLILMYGDFKQETCP